jgi:hypothetical protein
MAPGSADRLLPLTVPATRSCTTAAWAIVVNELTRMAAGRTREETKRLHMADFYLTTWNTAIELRVASESTARWQAKTTQKTKVHA